jgi:membrane dipeptidase
MNRRDFLVCAGASVAALALSPWAFTAETNAVPLPDLLVVDAHCDMFQAIELHNRENPKDRIALDLNAPRVREWEASRDRLRQGNVACIFLNMGENSLEDSIERLDATEKMCRESPKDYAICRTAEEIRKAREAAQIAIVLSIESMGMFNKNPALVTKWYDRGVRVMSLIHVASGLMSTSAPFTFSSPASRAQLRNQVAGLQPFAWDMIKEAHRNKIVIDLAHSNDAAFWEVIERTDGPICYTHGGCFALSNFGRNLTDEMMKALAKRGGVMGIGLFGNFIAQAREDMTLDRVCDHILHAIDIMGPDCVGFGSDFQGRVDPAPPPKSAAEVPQLFRRLQERGLDLPTLAKVAGENFLRLLPG